MTELAVHLTGPAARAALAKRDITTVYHTLCAAGGDPDPDRAGHGAAAV